MRRHHSTVAAYLALFLALGGGAAYARASITGDDVVNRTLEGVDLQIGAVTSAEIANGAVKGSDLDLKVTKVSNFATDDSASKTVTAQCPPGFSVLSGGARMQSDHGGIGKLVINASTPAGTTGWTADAGRVSFPSQKTNWSHTHDDFGNVVWKDWVWTNSADYKLDWTLTVEAICADLS